MSLETINAALLDLTPGDLLLDLGSGEGRHTISFGLSQQITAVGLDLSHADLKTATERLSDFQDLSGAESPRVCFTQGSGNQLPFKDQQFNKVVCSDVLEHIHDYQAFLQEIKRVIQPGGVFAVSVPAAFPVGLLETERCLPRDGRRTHQNFFSKHLASKHRAIRIQTLSIP